MQLRAENPHGRYDGPMLGLVSGTYPADPGQVALTSQVVGAKQRSVVDEARRRIELILDPPTPEVGAVYSGRVVNITKFGAFINILPGRDGLVHISRLGQGKRVERVEDVVTLGQELEVRCKTPMTTLNAARPCFPPVLTTTRAALLISMHSMLRKRSFLSAQARCARAIKG